MPRIISTQGNVTHVDFGRTDEPELTKKQLAARIGKSTRWIEQQVKKNGMPSRMDDPRRRRFFPLNQVQEWLDEQRKGAAHG